MALADVTCGFRLSASLERGDASGYLLVHYVEAAGVVLILCR